MCPVIVLAYVISNAWLCCIISYINIKQKCVNHRLSLREEVRVSRSFSLGDPVSGVWHRVMDLCLEEYYADPPLK